MAGRGNETDKRKKKRVIYKFKDLILFEDERIIVANKPTGISSLDEREFSRTNMLQLARAYNEDLKLCHRLDKMTSGALVFAKGSDIYREMAGLFARREVLKHYLTMISRARRFEEEVISMPIAVSGKGKARVDREDGKESITVVDSSEIFRGHSLLDCQPLTGRTHQIRVHLAAIGCPIVGDKEYGGQDIFLSEVKKKFKPNRKMEESPLNDGFLLHARGIRFAIPGDEEESTFIAPLPKNFEVTLKIMRKYGV